MHIEIEKHWSTLNTKSFNCTLLPLASLALTESPELEILPCLLYHPSQVFMLLLGIIFSSRQEETFFFQEDKTQPSHLISMVCNLSVRKGVKLTYLIFMWFRLLSCSGEDYQV